MPVMWKCPGQPTCRKIYLYTRGLKAHIPSCKYALRKEVRKKREDMETMLSIIQFVEDQQKGNVTVSRLGVPSFRVEGPVFSRVEVKVEVSSNYYFISQVSYSALWPYVCKSSPWRRRGHGCPEYRWEGIQYWKKYSHVVPRLPDEPGCGYLDSFRRKIFTLDSINFDNINKQTPRFQVKFPDIEYSSIFKNTCLPAK